MTQWSAISMARGADAGRAADGLDDLVTSYWRPLYLYLRKRGQGHADACDSVQGFFEFVLSSGFLSHVDRDGGKFRSYLLKSLERWLSRGRVHARAQKRGGDVTHVPLEDMEEMLEDSSLDDGGSPEDAFDRRWAAELVSRTVARLQDDYESRERADWFEALRPALPGGGGLGAYTELATALRSTEGAVKKAVFDLRKSFAAALRDEIRMTVRSKEDAEEELRYLVSVLADG